MRFADLEKRLAWWGYLPVRQNGSHRVYRDQEGHSLTVKVKPYGQYSKGELAGIWRSVRQQQQQKEAS